MRRFVQELGMRRGSAKKMSTALRTKGLAVRLCAHRGAGAE